MKLDSKYFDKIRIKTGPNKKEPPAPTMCEWPGCAKPSRHKAPKGRGFEGQFHNYCTQTPGIHKTYNYLRDEDDAVAGFQKDAQTAIGLPGNLAELLCQYQRHAPQGPECDVPMPCSPKQRSVNAKLGRVLRKNEIKALNTLGLDETATAEKAKSQYKLLVKRLHPDANGGSRENEDTLKAVIHAYDTLRASGFC